MVRSVASLLPGCGIPCGPLPELRLVCRSSLTLVSCALKGQQKKIKNQEKNAQPEKNKAQNRFIQPQKPPQKILRRCLARSQNLGHSQKKKNNRVATATKLSVACPKTPSKVRVLGARDLCAPQPQRKGTHAQKRTKESERKQNGHKQHRQQSPPRRKYVTCHATPKCAATKSATKTAPARKTNKR